MQLQVETVIALAGALLTTILGIVGTVSDNRTGEGKLTIAGRFAIIGIVLGAILSQVDAQVRHSHDLASAREAEHHAQQLFDRTTDIVRRIDNASHAIEANLIETKKSSATLVKTAGTVDENVKIGQRTLTETQLAASKLGTIAETSTATLLKTTSVSGQVGDNLLASRHIASGVQANLDRTGSLAKQAKAIQTQSVGIFTDVDRVLFPFKDSDILLSSTLQLDLQHPTFAAYLRRLDQVGSEGNLLLQSIGHRAEITDPQFPGIVFRASEHANIGVSSPWWPSPELRAKDSERNAHIYLMRGIEVRVYKARSGGPSAASPEVSSLTDPNGWDLALFVEGPPTIVYDWSHNTANVTADKSKVRVDHGALVREVVGVPDLLNAKIVVKMPGGLGLPKERSPFAPSTIVVHIGERRLTLTRAMLRPSRNTGTYWTVLPATLPELMAMMTRPQW